MSNHRDLANRAVEYQAQLRDAGLEKTGILVSAQLPVKEGSYSPLGDVLDEGRETVQLWVLPRYESYYNVLSVLGTDAENELPLEVVVKVTDHIPDDTLFELPEKTMEGADKSRTWRVTSTEIKHLEGFYSRIANCVPARI